MECFRIVVQERQERTNGRGERRSSLRSPVVRFPNQNVNRIAPCMMRGSRAAVALPKLALTCSPAGLNCAVVLMVSQFTWLNTLYISQRNWMRRPPPSEKFLNAEMFEFTIFGSR